MKEIQHYTGLSFYVPNEIYTFVNTLREKYNLEWNSFLKEGLECIKENGFIGDGHFMLHLDQIYHLRVTHKFKKHILYISFTKTNGEAIKNFKLTYGLHWTDFLYQSALCLHYKYENKLNSLVKVDVVCKKCGKTITVNAINVDNVIMLKWIPPMCPNCRLMFNILRIDLKIRS